MSIYPTEVKCIKRDQMDKNNNKGKYSLNISTVDQKHVKPFTLCHCIFTITLCGTSGLLLTDEKNNLEILVTFSRSHN